MTQGWLQAISVLVAGAALWLKFHAMEKNHLHSIVERLDKLGERIARIEGKLGI